jgi:acetolactate synthase I/II/III large subunit
MKTTDYIFKYLADNEVTDIFLVSGGGIAHLLDSLHAKPEINYYCNHHEQACAVAAEGYARASGKLGVCLVTLGPGAVNALSGIIGSWVDSIPMLIISGQVRSDLIADYSKLRQKGPQEANVIEMAKPVTKYVVSIRNPKDIRYELEKAIWIATNGRPGPVWLEIPFDIQGAEIVENSLLGFTHPRNELDTPEKTCAQTESLANAIINAKRPLIIAGNGVRLAKCQEKFIELIEKYSIPVVLPFSAKDILIEDHPMNMGIFGTNGQRRANFALQNADLIISLGSGLSATKTGFNYKGFAPKAKKIIIDIDSDQVFNQVLEPDLPIVANVKSVLESILKDDLMQRYKPEEKWLQACAMWKAKYKLVLDEYFQDPHHVNMYVFMDKLSDHLQEKDILVTGNGFDVVSCYQNYRVSGNQRVLLSGNWGSMGWDLPMAIGASVANSRGRVIVTCGDGSIQWNIQELLTIAHYSLPIKIFIFNNEGYSSIRATQKTLFNSRFVGADISSGVAQIDYRKLADLHGFEYYQIKSNDSISEIVTQCINQPGPCICELKISKDQIITPKASAFRTEDGRIESRPLEDMAPFLPREEIYKNMHLFDE